MLQDLMPHGGPRILGSWEECPVLAACWPGAPPGRGLMAAAGPGREALGLLELRVEGRKP